nr:putative integron gene cassette protein [uncultured bacterium]
MTSALGAMLEMLSKNAEFESLARQFLAAHPEVHHEWRQIRGLFGWGVARTDLLCSPGEEREVFASLNGGQITVGTKAEDTDFESWGRKMSRAEVEREAFTFFVRLLERNGIVASPKHAA